VVAQGKKINKHGMHKFEWIQFDFESFQEQFCSIFPITKMGFLLLTALWQEQLVHFNM
jgi:hypothetical protein